MKRWRRVLGLVVVLVLVAGGWGATAAPGDETVHFTAAGDYAMGTNASAVMNTIGSIDHDLHLSVGDLSYGVTGEEQTWCDFVTSRVGAGFPFELLAGNHESNGQNGNINDFSACLPNQIPGVIGTYGRQYYMDYPQVTPLVRFINISPDLNFGAGEVSYASGTQGYQWTSAAIDGARAKGVPWIVVTMHKPCMSIGMYGCEIGADITNLMQTKKVDLVLNGHEHLYQRTHQLGLSASCPQLTPPSFNNTCVTDADNTYSRGAGTIWATVGTGGQALRDVNASDPEAGYFAASQGSNKTPAWGVLEVTATADTLSGSFHRASGSTAFSDAFTITAGITPPNTPPTASFTNSCTNLACSFNGTGSTDSEGPISSYAWDFGSATGTGATTTHTFPAAGTYPVTLTVTDSGGLTDSQTRSITVTGPTGPPTVAAEDFQRTLTGSWGTATQGGPWTLGGPTLFSVANGEGVLQLNAGSGPTASLNQVSTASTDLQVTIAVNKLPTGGSGVHLSTVGRKATAGQYRVKVKVTTAGAVTLTPIRTTSTGTETSLAAESRVGTIVLQPGTKLKVRVQVTGTSPTTVRARAWLASATEPSTWTVSATDSTSGLQTAGAVGFVGYLSSATTNAPILINFDDLVVTAP